MRTYSRLLSTLPGTSTPRSSMARQERMNGAAIRTIPATIATDTMERMTRIRLAQRFILPQAAGIWRRSEVSVSQPVPVIGEVIVDSGPLQVGDLQRTPCRRIARSG